jgi:CubicO group peptidase (beta-lactamase class C family)
MRQHGVQMPAPTAWGRGRLIIYYPPHDPGTNTAYRACDHFRVLAKQQGGPHQIPGPGATSSPDPAGGPGQAAAAAKRYLGGLVARHQFSGAVLIAWHGRVLLRAGFGVADQARHEPNTPSTRFRIASLTKQFTAMAVLQLQDEGRLNVADRLCRFLSRCPAAWQPITLAELLANTSGVPDYTTLPGYGRLSRQHTTPAQLAALVAGRPLLFRPGTRWSYSNTGYVLLGMTIARVSGLSYPTFLARHVFAPLGLRNTGYDSSHPSPPAHAIGYVSNGQPAPYLDMSVPYAAGALYSTVADLSRWDDALLTGRPQLLRPATLHQMFRPRVAVVPGQAAEGSYGYGWFIDRGGAEYDHDGQINGFVAQNSLFPRAGAQVIVLANLEPSDVRTITERLAAMIGLRAR